jgi:aminoacrylate hydrolase
MADSGLIDGLFYEWAGRSDEEAETLILSSGLGGSAGYWSPNLPQLAARYRILLYDHRGTGRSDRALPEDCTVETMAGDVLRLMDRLAITRAHFVGHAAGGLIGLMLALNAPDRLDRLVVVNGWAAADPHFLRCFEARLALLRNSGPRAFLRAQPIFLYPAPWISAHSERLDAEMEQQLAHFPGAEIIERRIAALSAFDISARLSEIQTPVLALAAADDMLVPAPCSTALADALPNARLSLMPSGGHACNVTKPAMFDSLVLDFLARREGSDRRAPDILVTPSGRT